MKTLILAAGQGGRLENLTDHLPKALVKVNGEELIRYQLAFLNDPHVTQIGLVTGYQSKPLTEFIKRHAPKVALFENTQFEKGSILSLKSAVSFLNDDFLLMNVDHIYPKRLLHHILKQTKDITACCDFDRPLVTDDMKVKLDGKGKLKEIHKNLNQYNGGYIGMTYCTREKISIYLNALETTLAKLGSKASVEMILGQLAKEGETIHIADASGIRWLEVDTPEDLKRAEDEVKNI